MHHPFGRKAFSFAAAASALILSSLAPALGQDATWSFSGNDLGNTRNAANEKKITVANASGLSKKWEFSTNGDVSATPTVEPNGGGGATLYVPDWAGYLYCINGNTGTAIWTKKLSDYTGNSRTVSRTSPAIAGSQLVFGDQGDLDSGGFAHGATTASVMSVNKSSGKLTWRTIVSDHPFSCITSSPVVYNGVVYVGLSSLEENASFAGPGYPFSFRGKVLALDAKSGAILWATKTIPDSLAPTYDGQGNVVTAGYTGASVWGSNPVVDIKRGSLYVGTGNNYSAPEGIGNPGNSLAAADDHIDSVLALNLKTGAIKWATRTITADTWDVGRGFLYSYDPEHQGPDYDFGSAPNLFTLPNGTQYVGAGQKSGQYHALNPDTGVIQWTTQAGPGGTGGGIEWGSAVDGNRVYCAYTNSDNKAYTFSANPGGVTPTLPFFYSGSWAGIDAASGSILWQTADPFGGHDPGAVTVANGVVFAGSTGLPPLAFPGFSYPGTYGGFVALNAATGAILWQLPVDSAVNSGPAIVDGVVYWGTGYTHLGNAFGKPGSTKLYAFTTK